MASLQVYLQFWELIPIATAIFSTVIARKSAIIPSTYRSFYSAVVLRAQSQPRRSWRQGPIQRSVGRGVSGLGRGRWHTIRSIVQGERPDPED